MVLPFYKQCWKCCPWLAVQGLEPRNMFVDSKKTTECSPNCSVCHFHSFLKLSLICVKSLLKLYILKSVWIFIGSNVSVVIVENSFVTAVTTICSKLHNVENQRAPNLVLFQHGEYWCRALLRRVPKFVLQLTVFFRSYYGHDREFEAHAKRQW